MYYYFINHTPCESTAKKPDAQELTEEQYKRLLYAISVHNDPAPDGKYWQLEVNGEWTLHDLPPIPNDPAPPTEAERLEALENWQKDFDESYRMGVNAV